MRIIRRICRNRRLRSADVAKTLPWEPAASTAMEAMSTMMSVGDGRARGGAGPPAPPFPAASEGGPQGDRQMDGRHMQRASKGTALLSTLPSPALGSSCPNTSPLLLPLRPHSPQAWTPRGQAEETSRSSQSAVSACLPGQHAPSALSRLAACLHPPGLTYHTEGLPGKLEPPPPAAVPAAAACRPDPHKVLHTEHHDGHDFLQGRPH